MNDGTSGSHASHTGDTFDGAWLVTEYVYDPDGSYRGKVSQQRCLERVGPNRLLVTQHCIPAPELDSHPMADFAGEWVFEVEVSGTSRLYMGPDVVGFGIEWQTGAMTGQGLWPRFGYEFESYAVLVACDRQLTGGCFSLAGRPIAEIVGVAVPESSGLDPRLELSATPPELGEEGDGWTLDRTVSRTIGPMRVSVAWPLPSRRLRQWAMRDPLGNTGIMVTEVQEGDNHSVSVIVD